MPNYLNPLQKRFAATQQRFAVPRVTGQYEQMPQGTGGGTGANPFGAFQQRQAPRAPWMNDANPITMGQYNQPQFASTAPAQSSPQATFNARQMRADASGGRLIAQPGPVPGANRGNYSFSDAGDQSPGAINVQRMLAQNPAAFHGFSDASKAKITQGGINPLAGIQQAYRERQAQNANALAGRQQMVQANAMARGDARRGRLDARAQGPSTMDMLMQQDPETALAAMQLQQHGQEINQRGQLGLAQIMAGQQANAGLAELRGSEAKLNLAKADPARMQAERHAALVQSAVEAGTMTLEEAQQAMAAPQGPGALAGPPSKAKVQEQTDLAALLRSDPQTAVDKMRAMGLPDDEINKRLAAAHAASGVNGLGGYARSFFTGTKSTPGTADNPLGGTDVSPGINPLGIGAAIGAAQNWLFPRKIREAGRGLR